MDGASPAFHFGDSLSYYSLGKAIAFGKPYEYTEDHFTVFRTPGYPTLLLPVFRAFGPSPPAIVFRLENVAFSLVGILLSAWWAWRMGGKRPPIPVFVVAILAVSPGAVAISFLILTEAAFIPWMLGALIFWDAALQYESGASAKGERSAFFIAVLSGCASGVAALIRPSWMLFPPMAAAFFLLVGGGVARRRHALVALGIGLGMAVVMAPWWWRNAELTGRFVPTTLQTGTSLLDAWNSDADGSSRWEPVQRVIDARREEFFRDHGHRPGDATSTPAERMAFEIGVNETCGQAARRWAVENPGQVTWLALQKFGRLWNPIPNESAFRAWPVLIVSILLYIPVVAGAMFVVFRTFFHSVAGDTPGAAGTIPARIPVLLCILPIMYFTAIHMVFVSSIRYREPLIPLMVILAAQVVCGKCGEMLGFHRLCGFAILRDGVEGYRWCDRKRNASGKEIVNGTSDDTMPADGSGGRRNIDFDRGSGDGDSGRYDAE